jgi:hypothetical protein
LIFSIFSPLHECVDTKWAQRTGLRSKGQHTHPSDQNHAFKEQRHLAWAKPQRPISTWKTLNATKTQTHDPSRRGTKGSTPIMERPTTHDPSRRSTKDYWCSLTLIFIHQ